MDSLDAYVKELRDSKEEWIPEFSPHDGRTQARVLFLLRDPGNSGAAKTRVVDRCNPGPTAKNFREANEKADLNRRLTVSWNAVPWPVRENSTFGLQLEEVRRGEWLVKLLRLLPQLHAVVLLGGDAHKLTPDLYAIRPDLHVLHGPHPSWRGINTLARRKWLEDTVRKARDLVV